MGLVRSLAKVSELITNGYVAYMREGFGRYGGPTYELHGTITRDVHRIPFNIASKLIDRGELIRLPRSGQLARYGGKAQAAAEWAEYHKKQHQQIQRYALSAAARADKLAEKLRGLPEGEISREFFLAVLDLDKATKRVESLLDTLLGGERT